MKRTLEVLKPIAGFKVGKYNVEHCKDGIPLSKQWRKALKHNTDGKFIKAPAKSKAATKVKKSEDKD